MRYHYVQGAIARVHRVQPWGMAAQVGSVPPAAFMDRQDLSLNPPMGVSVVGAAADGWAVVL